MAGKELRTIPRRTYETELLRLQTELVKLQEWVVTGKKRVAVVFEGRDAAGKGGAIKRLTEHLNPRVTRVVALPRPTERERTQWYFQRYVEHLPAGGEIVLFDRSWYNRAGVEHVMGFCTGEEHRRFLRHCPVFERMLVEDGLLLRKYWFSVSDVEQQKRFRRRLEDPLRRWKLSSVDLESITRWEAYSRAKDEMMAATDTPESPWYVVESDDKRRARLNMIAHLLDSVAYHDVPPPRSPSRNAHRRPDTHGHPGSCRRTSRITRLACDRWLREAIGAPTCTPDARRALGVRGRPAHGRPSRRRDPAVSRQHTCAYMTVPSSSKELLPSGLVRGRRAQHGADGPEGRVPNGPRPRHEGLRSGAAPRGTLKVRPCGLPRHR